MINGKVARTLDSLSVVLNVGLEDGVTEAMEFVIYEEGPDITDPDTGENLGKLELVKGRVAVTSVQEKFCVARAHTKTIVQHGLSARLQQQALQQAMRDLASFPFRDTESQTKVVPDGFKIEVEDEVRLPSKTVRVGDLAHSLPDRE